MSRVLVNSENRISCPYGKYKTSNPALNGKDHNGVDIAPSTIEEENKIYANCKGVVYEIQDGLDRNVNATGKETWGNFVLIKHPNGMFSRYAHLQKRTIQVKVGQEVNESTYLGMMGESGITYGRHEHFEVATGYSSNTRIDPTPYLTKPLWEESAQSDTQNSSECTTTNKYKVNCKDGLLLLDESGKKVKVFPINTEVDYISDGYDKYGYHYLKVQAENQTGYMAQMYLTRIGTQTTYIVKSGDTISQIAKDFYGVTTKTEWDLIKNTNNLNDKYAIKTGQILIIPSKN